MEQVSSSEDDSFALSPGGRNRSQSRGRNSKRKRSSRSNVRRSRNREEMSEARPTSYTANQRFGNEEEPFDELAPKSPAITENQDIKDRAMEVIYQKKISQLKGSRESVQKNTFTKWVNSVLRGTNLYVEDLYRDLRDGRVLITLLEILSQEKLPRPTRGKMRIHCLENVDKALTFMQMEKRVQLENIGAHDIADGNPRLTLGLIWTIILRFRIQDVVIEEDGSQTKSAKDALLLWCQMKTADYSNVNVRNFTTSWKDGLAFNAIIHKHRPELIDYASLTAQNPTTNLSIAFGLAESIGLDPLINPEDLEEDWIDEKSIMTYLVTYYHYFSKLKKGGVSVNRITKVLENQMRAEEDMNNYTLRTTKLLRWIEKKIEELGDRTFKNSLEGVRNHLQDFNLYRKNEKPPKFGEKGNLEVELFNLQSKMREENKMAYVSDEKLSLADVNRKWETLEKAEYERESALREELLRQEKLEQLAAKFSKKAGMRESWIKDNQRLIDTQNFGKDLRAAETAAKKHEALETDIFAYEERIKNIVVLAMELENNKYHEVEAINRHRDNVVLKWEQLIRSTRERKMMLEVALRIQHHFFEIGFIKDSIVDIRHRIVSGEVGKHLEEVQDLLRQLSLVEADINVIAESVKIVAKNTEKFIQQGGNDDYSNPEKILDLLQELEVSFEDIVKLAVERRSRLEKAKEMWQFYADMTEHENWAKEMTQILSHNDIGDDLSGAIFLTAKVKSLETEIHSRETLLQESLAIGEVLIQEGLFDSDAIQHKIEEVLVIWGNLDELISKRKRKLNEAVAYHQLMNNLDDSEDWLSFTCKIVASNIELQGLDEFSIETLQRNHEQVDKTLMEYRTTLDTLHREYTDLDSEETLLSPVQAKLDIIEEKYNQLIEESGKKKENLLLGMSYCNLQKNVDIINQWIEERRKMLTTMKSGTDIEDCEIMKHRFEGYNHDIQNNSGKVVQVLQTAKALLDSDNFNKNDITALIHELNKNWSSLLSQITIKKNELNEENQMQTFYVECKETVSWIKEKIKILMETEQLEMDLSGIIILQRKIHTIIKEKSAIEIKTNSLKEEGGKLIGKCLDNDNKILKNIESLNKEWKRMTSLYKITEEKLGEAGELHQFLKNLDHFQSWLSKTESDISHEETATSVMEAEKVLLSHKQIGEEIERFKADYNNLMKYGEKISDDPTTFQDPQYMFLRERLKALKDVWAEIGNIWFNKSTVLEQSLSLLLFTRDSKYVEGLLSHQEILLSKDKTPTNIEQAEEFVKKQEELLTIMDVNDEKIDSLLKFSKKICKEKHFSTENIGNKTNKISERRDQNRTEANLQMERIYDQHLLYMFLYDCEQFFIWIHEKNCSVQDDTYRSARTVHGKWTKHQAIESEIASNKGRLEELKYSGEDLCETKPHMKDPVQAAIGDLELAFEKLQKALEEKEERLFGNKRFNIFDQSCDEICNFANETQAELLSNPIENAQNLTSVNIMMKKQQIIETKLQVKIQEASKIEGQIEQLVQIDPTKKEDLLSKHQVVDETFFSVIPNLESRNAELKKLKDTLQFKQDINDEVSWIEEKYTIVGSQVTGNSLQEVIFFKKKIRTLHGETVHHDSRIQTVVNTGQTLINKSHPEADAFKHMLEDLQEKWVALKDAIEIKNHKLSIMERIYQFFFDLGELESWISEQELYVISTDMNTDEIGIQKLLRKQKNIETAIEDHESIIDELNKTSKQLKNEHMEYQEVIDMRMKHVASIFENLNIMVTEQRTKLEGNLNLGYFNKAVKNLEQWILSKEITASSTELGQDYSHVILLSERFEKFSHATQDTCKASIQEINEMADNVIKNGHGDTEIVLEWRENINNAVDELVELLETRKQMLNASRELHKFFHDANDILTRIDEQKNSINQDLGRDGPSVSALQKHDRNFIQNFLPIENEIVILQESLSFLIEKYAGEKAWEISNLEKEVLRAWKDLQEAVELRSEKLTANGDLYGFLAMVRVLMNWMHDIIQQMSTSEKPRDVPGVQVLINNHQITKSEMDERAESFMKVQSYGKILLSLNYFDGDMIKGKILDLMRSRNEMENRWEERWEHLQIILEVFEFARDATLAEEWLIVQEKYLMSDVGGDSVDQIEQLIRKHDTIQKSYLAQEERFLALETLTQFELNDKQRRDQESYEEQKRLKQMDRTDGRNGTPEETNTIQKGDSANFKSPLSVRTSDTSSPQQDPSQTDPNSINTPLSANSPASFNNPNSPTSSMNSPISPTSARDSGTSTPTTAFFPRHQSATYKGSGRSSAGSEKKRHSKSPFGSFKLKKSKTLEPQSNNNYPNQTEEDGDNGDVEGTLMRKCEWETSSRKSSHRSWDQVCVVLRDSQLFFYKDWKSYHNTPQMTFRGEKPLQLVASLASVAHDYKKRNNVFRLRTGTGAEYLFQCPREENMTQWVLAINALADQVNRSVVHRPNMDAGRSSLRSLNHREDKDAGPGSIRSLNQGPDKDAGRGSIRSLNHGPDKDAGRGSIRSLNHRPDIEAASLRSLNSASSRSSLAGSSRSIGARISRSLKTGSHRNSNARLSRDLISGSSRSLTKGSPGNLDKM